MKDRELLLLAIKAAKNSYSPYSNFRVGAALLSKSGKIFLGCNVENSAYGDTICAERTAFLKAISEGEREFEKIAIVGSKTDDFSAMALPCGSCRQVMSEFCDENFKIVLMDKNDVKVFTLSEIFPAPFNKNSLN